MMMKRVVPNFCFVRHTSRRDFTTTRWTTRDFVFPGACVATRPGCRLYNICCCLSFAFRQINGSIDNRTCSARGL